MHMAGFSIGHTISSSSSDLASCPAQAAAHVANSAAAPAETAASTPPQRHSTDFGTGIRALVGEKTCFTRSRHAARDRSQNMQ